MRTIAIIVSLLATSSLAIVTVTSRSIDAESRTSDNPYYTDIESTRDESLLEEFVASLDKDKIAEFVDGQDDIGLDNLAACGDFDVYARYMRISKFEAVRKFRYIMLHSSSKLEFRHRLAR